ncbi:MAG: DUF6504 family protein [Phycisphaerae bacterium]
MGFVSDPISPHGRGFDAVAMGRGEPGLPSAFTWRGAPYEIDKRLGAWKESQREGGRAGGELYLRRHYYKLRMTDGSVWTVYFVRQPATRRAAKSRWFLYTMEPAEPGNSAPIGTATVNERHRESST